MTKAVHPIAGGIALLTILTFWLSTAFSELFANAATVTTVKTLIPWGFVILIPALMAVGGSGCRLGKKMRGSLVAAKKKRMPFIAANGILILIPSALYLSFKAQAGAFDTVFYAVQGIELSYCQIWCLGFVGHAAIWSGFVASIPSLNVTPVMTLAR